MYLWGSLKAVGYYLFRRFDLWPQLLLGLLSHCHM